jgi:resuscitation-promoting factor RpfA
MAVTGGKQMQTRENRAWPTACGLLLGSALTELALLQLAGGPTVQLSVLTRVARPDTDPVTALLATLTLVAELLAGYLMLVITLRVAACLPGIPGHAAAAAGRLTTLPAARRCLDAALGGVLLAQTALVPPAAQARPAPPTTRPPITATETAARAGTAAIQLGVLIGLSDTPAPSTPPTPPTIRTMPAPPLPTWLGGTPTAPPRAQAGAPVSEHTAHPAAQPQPYTIRPGDSLWSIAASHLPAGSRRTAIIDTYWRRIYRANRQHVGADPNLVFPGAVLTIPTWNPLSSLPR